MVDDVAKASLNLRKTRALLPGKGRSKYSTLLLAVAAAAAAVVVVVVLRTLLLVATRATVVDRVGGEVEATRCRMEWQRRAVWWTGRQGCRGFRRRSQAVGRRSHSACRPLVVFWGSWAGSRGEEVWIELAKFEGACTIKLSGGSLCM